MIQYNKLLSITNDTIIMIVWIGQNVNEMTDRGNVAKIASTATFNFYWPF